MRALLLASLFCIFAHAEMSEYAYCKRDIAQDRREWLIMDAEQKAKFRGESVTKKREIIAQLTTNYARYLECKYTLCIKGAHKVPQSCFDLLKADTLEDAAKHSKVIQYATDQNYR